VSLLVLDTSAIVAFAAGSVDVGEPIAEVHSDGGRVVIPVVCLIEAARQVGDDMPRLLVDNPACEVAPLTEELWAAVTAGARILGRLDLAMALLAATTGEASEPMFGEAAISWRTVWDRLYPEALYPTFGRPDASLPCSA
jgi:hypothetical protein